MKFFLAAKRACRRGKDVSKRVPNSTVHYTKVTTLGGHAHVFSVVSAFLVAVARRHVGFSHAFPRRDGVNVTAEREGRRPFLLGAIPAYKWAGRRRRRRRSRRRREPCRMTRRKWLRWQARAHERALSSSILEKGTHEKRTFPLFLLFPSTSRRPIKGTPLYVASTRPTPYTCVPSWPRQSPPPPQSTFCMRSGNLVLSLLSSSSPFKITQLEVARKRVCDSLGRIWSERHARLHGSRGILPPPAR